MQSNASREHGFTLIEVLVVIVIIGVALTFATLSVNPTGPGDRLDTESKRLLALAQTAADEAVLSGQTIGLQIGDHEYRFLALDEHGWQPITAPDSALHPRRVADDIYLDRVGRDGDRSSGDDQARRLARPVSPIAGYDATDARARDESDNDDEPLAVPAALFLSSGELLPFTLEVSAKDIDHRFDIIGRPNGDIQRRRVDR